MKLLDYLTRDSIIIRLTARDKESVIREMAEKLYSAKLIRDSYKVEKSLLDREKLGSTGIGDNVAIPHAKCDGMDGIIAMFAWSEKGVDFDALDNKKVHFFFLLLAPNGEPVKHLKLLARISRLVRLDGFCPKLAKRESPDEIMKIIEVAEQSF